MLKRTATSEAAALTAAKLTPNVSTKSFGGASVWHSGASYANYRSLKTGSATASRILFSSKPSFHGTGRHFTTERSSEAALHKAYKERYDRNIKSMPERLERINNQNPEWRAMWTPYKSEATGAPGREQLDSFSRGHASVDKSGKVHIHNKEFLSRQIPSVKEEELKTSGSDLKTPSDLERSQKAPSHPDDEMTMLVERETGGKFKLRPAHPVILNNQKYPEALVWKAMFDPSLRDAVTKLGELIKAATGRADRLPAGMPFYFYSSLADLIVANTPALTDEHITEAETKTETYLERLYDDPNFSHLELEGNAVKLEWEDHPTLRGKGEASHFISSIVETYRDGTRHVFRRIEGTGALNHPEMGQRPHSPGSESRQQATDFAMQRSVVQGKDISHLSPRIQGRTPEIRNLVNVPLGKDAQVGSGMWTSQEITAGKRMSREAARAVLPIVFLVEKGGVRIYGRQIPNPNEKFAKETPHVQEMIHASLGPHGQGSGSFNCVNLHSFFQSLVAHYNAGRSGFGLADFPATNSTSESFSKVFLTGLQQGEQFFDAKGHPVPTERLFQFMGPGLRNYLANDTNSNWEVRGIGAEKGTQIFVVLDNGVTIPTMVGGDRGERGGEGVDGTILWDKARYQIEEVKRTFLRGDGSALSPYQGRVFESYVRESGTTFELGELEVNQVLALVPKSEKGPKSEKA